MLPPPQPTASDNMQPKKRSLRGVPRALKAAEGKSEKEGTREGGLLHTRKSFAQSSTHAAARAAASVG